MPDPDPHPKSTVLDKQQALRFSKSLLILIVSFLAKRGECLVQIFVHGNIL